MNYLIYIEHAAENLQFFLWYRDYVTRFNLLPANEQALAPSWSIEKLEAEMSSPMGGATGVKAQISAETAEVFKGTGFASPSSNIMDLKSPNPFSTPTRTSLAETENITPSTVQDQAWSEKESTLNDSYFTAGRHQKKAAGAFEGADVKWQPCLSSPSKLSFVKLTQLYQSQYSHSAKRYPVSSLLTSQTALLVN